MELRVTFHLDLLSRRNELFVFAVSLPENPFYRRTDVIKQKPTATQ